jgi:glycosyltransferase involved in cell wall biosynthesis
MDDRIREPSGKSPIQAAFEKPSEKRSCCNLPRPNVRSFSILDCPEFFVHPEFFRRKLRDPASFRQIIFMPSQKTLTVGIPCYNESATVGKVVSDFHFLFPDARILVIDNASTDDTALVAQQHGAEVVAENRKGKGHAVQRLFREVDSDYLIMVDGDDTYPAEEAAKLIAAIESKGGDTIVGVRKSAEKGAFKATHTWANHLLAIVIESIFRTSVGDLFSGFRLFTKTYYRNIPILSTGFEIETELALQTIDKGFEQRNVEINFRSRPEGSFSKLDTVQDGFRVFWTLVAIVKHYKPMLFFSTASIVLFLASLCAGFFPIMDFLEFHYVYRVPLSILATGLMVLSALSLTCGMILDTIVRLSRERFFVQMRHFYSAEAASRQRGPLSFRRPADVNPLSVVQPEPFDLEEPTASMKPFYPRGPA